MSGGSMAKAVAAVQHAQPLQHRRWQTPGMAGTGELASERFADVAGLSAEEIAKRLANFLSKNHARLKAEG